MSFSARIGRLKVDDGGGKEKVQRRDGEFQKCGDWGGVEKELEAYIVN